VLGDLIKAWSDGAKNVIITGRSCKGANYWLSVLSNR
jgi:hypothetical protein